MKLRKKISNKLVLKLAIFAMLISTAVLFDVYIENNDLVLDEIQTESNESSNEMGAIHLVSQANIVSVKSSINKAPTRKIQVKSHDKFIQKYHQLRNYEVYKAEVLTIKAPEVLSYHYLGLRNYHFTMPDDDPYLS